MLNLEAPGRFSQDLQSSMSDALFCIKGLLVDDTHGGNPRWLTTGMPTEVKGLGIENLVPLVRVGSVFHWWAAGEQQAEAARGDPHPVGQL